MTQPLRLLLVEDSESDAELVTRHLRRAGYAVEPQRVETELDMRDALQQGDWDLIVSDFNLPQFDMDRALDLLHASGQDVPFIIVSGTITEDIAVRMMRRGVQDFVLKDNLSRLAPAVQRELGEVMVRRERRRSDAALLESQTKLALAAQVFESSSEGILIADASGVIATVNKAFSQISGYPAEAVLGQRVDAIGLFEEIDRLLESAVAAGTWKGDVWCRRKTQERFPAWLSLTAVRNAAGEFVNSIVMLDDISEYKASEARIQYLAHYDVLTDLPNRTLLRDRMSQVLQVAEQRSDSVAFLFVDLDRFKAINDSLGHHVGDIVLKAVAQRLKRCVREADIVARIGGDEFVIVLPQTDKQGAEEIARRIIAVLGESHVIDAHTLDTTPSVGISVYPKDGRDADTLIKNADAALNMAKTQGRNQYLFFTQPMSVLALERMQLEQGLRRALERNEFRLVYQPQIGLAKRGMIGVEALIRWKHPEMGPISPARFIPLAEACGLILPIGEWVLREACRQNAAWQQRGVAPFLVSVNMSALQLKHADFANVVESALKDSGLEAHFLELELTETIVMAGAESVVTNVRELSRRGVRFSIDDFGTGYSNLSYLKRFPLSKLKIDRSFVSDATSNEDDAVIVRSIISLAHSLRLGVIAEGVESLEQLRFLQAEQCDEVQGFLFSQPLEASEVLAYRSDPNLI